MTFQGWIIALKAEFEAEKTEFEYTEKLKSQMEIFSIDVHCTVLFLNIFVWIFIEIEHLFMWFEWKFISFSLQSKLYQHTYDVDKLMVKL